MLQQTNAQLRSDLDAIMKDRFDNAGQPADMLQTFTISSNDTVIKDFLDEEARSFEDDLSDFLSGSHYDDGTNHTTTDVCNMDYSYERLALLSLQWNDNPSLSNDKRLLAVGENAYSIIG